MPRLKGFITRWGPAIVWAAAIFVSSATPSSQLPRFGSLDYVVKKGGHMLAYGLLALLCSRGFAGGARRSAWAWLLAVGYALVDEFHQSFVPGRHPSLEDALLFDGGGAALALAGTWLIGRMSARGLRGRD